MPTIGRPAERSFAILRAARARAPTERARLEAWGERRARPRTGWHAARSDRPSMMLRPIAMNFTMNDPADRLDARAWRAIVLRSLARSDEGLLVCGVDHQILFSTPRGARVLERLAAPVAGRLPPIMIAAVERLGTESVRSERFPLTGGIGIGGVQVDLAVLHDAAPAHVLLWLREELVRDGELYERMKQRFGVTLRGFQLAQLVRQGLSNREIAVELRLAESTIKVYLSELFQQCGVSSRTALVALVERVGKSG